MKIHKLVDVLGAINDTGKLASDMYDLGKKHYYSESKGQKIPVSEMDFQYMVRAFVKLCDQENMLDRSKHMGTTKDLIKDIDTKDIHIKELMSNLEYQKKIIAGLRSQVETLRELLKEKEELLDKEVISKNNWREAYYDDCSTRGSRYVFTEIPNNEYGKKLTRGMKVYLNDESYTMRVRGQHIKPELRGTGATNWGQSIEQSTHLRVYIDKKKA
jgi:hypothetical protein